eukprot:TRINITY_DN2233_c0_g1_i1.p1 TRINITY_DN2233_c0_g1~~TRINITY_DN2233_c0_g1_i1.p1  ORF type:complete len:174 (+),score=29.66 TRINITY_DN2233_c0_g1_i1:99-620(+)
MQFLRSVRPVARTAPVRSLGVATYTPSVFATTPSRFYAAHAQAKDNHGHDAHHHHDTTALEEEVKDGSKNETRVTGMERLELEGMLQDCEGEEVLKGPFGTKENPVLVTSWFNARIVGCHGGPGEDAHELLWHEVRKEKPTVCLECGQFFQLKDHPQKAEAQKTFDELHGHHH